MRMAKKGFVLLVMLVALFACRGVDAKASAPSENIDVTVFKDLEMICPEDSLYGSEELSIINNSLVPIKITTVHVEEHNGWELVEEDAALPKDSKKVFFELDRDTILAGENDVEDCWVGAKYHAEYYPTMRHAIWTYSAESELAFTFTFEYEIGSTLFWLTLDSDGGTIDELWSVDNGAEIELPIPEKEGYEFVGWEDEEGIIYTDSFTMPIGDTTLKAKWKEGEAYAVYSAGDNLLWFVKSAKELKEGEWYRGRYITKLYEGVEEFSFQAYNDAPWYKDGTYVDVQWVYAEDEITPISTAYWFYDFINCTQFELENLNTESVTSMSYMFCYAGNLSGLHYVMINGMESWDTGNVVDMSHMFDYVGSEQYGVRLGDLSGWDVSNVVNMEAMFCDCGAEATVIELEGIEEWDVGNVTDFSFMFCNFGTHIRDWNVGNLGKWNVSNGSVFGKMFSYAGQYSQTFYVGNLENWNTQSATCMCHMFEYSGMNAEWQLDCSGWNVDKITERFSFCTLNEDKITQPKWKN